MNDRAVGSTDPLALANETTNVLLDEDVDYNGNIFHITAVEIDSNGSKLNMDLSANLMNQGFYIVRNNRQIARAITIGNYKKHNSLNRFRCEISYSSDLDDHI